MVENILSTAPSGPAISRARSTLPSASTYGFGSASNAATKKPKLSLPA